MLWLFVCSGFELYHMKKVLLLAFALVVCFMNPGCKKDKSQTVLFNGFGTNLKIKIVNNDNGNILYSDQTGGTNRFSQSFKIKPGTHVAMTVSADGRQLGAGIVCNDVYIVRYPDVSINEGYTPQQPVTIQAVVPDQN